MKIKKSLGLLLCVLFVVSSFAQMGKMAARGKAELSNQWRRYHDDFGQPALNGRDLFHPELLGKLKPGESWRMGNNMATVLKTDADLSFGSIKVAKGSYSLF